MMVSFDRAKVSKMTIPFAIPIGLLKVSKVIIILIHPNSQKIYKKFTKEKTV